MNKIILTLFTIFISLGIKSQTEFLDALTKLVLESNTKKATEKE